MRLSRITALILACFMTLTLLSACGTSNNTPGSTTSTPGNSETSDTPGTETVTGGLHNLEDGVLDVGTGINWDTLTPFRSNIGNNAPYAPLLYETLAKLTYEKDYVPIVAKSWSAEDDGVTFNIEIYDYVTDSAGNKITASDIVWMIEASMEAGLKPAFAKVDSVEQTGDYTLKVKMKQDMVGAFEQILTNTFVVSKAAYEASKDQFATEVVSTSQYRLTEFISGSVISFEKRDDYWQKDNLIPTVNAANVDKISFRIITEASQAGIALETGEIDAYMIQIESVTILLLL